MLLFWLYLLNRSSISCAPPQLTSVTGVSPAHGNVLWRMGAEHGGLLVADGATGFSWRQPGRSTKGRWVRVRLCYLGLPAVAVSPSVPGLSPVALKGNTHTRVPGKEAPQARDVPGRGKPPFCLETLLDKPKRGKGVLFRS